MGFIVTYSGAILVDAVALLSPEEASLDLIVVEELRSAIGQYDSEEPFEVLLADQPFHRVERLCYLVLILFRQLDHELETDASEQKREDSGLLVALPFYAVHLNG